MKNKIGFLFLGMAIFFLCYWIHDLFAYRSSLTGPLSIFNCWQSLLTILSFIAVSVYSPERNRKTKYKAWEWAIKGATAAFAVWCALDQIKIFPGDGETDISIAQHFSLSGGSQSLIVQSISAVLFFLMISTFVGRLNPGEEEIEEIINTSGDQQTAQLGQPAAQTA